MDEKLIPSAAEFYCVNCNWVAGYTVPNRVDVTRPPCKVCGGPVVGVHVAEVDGKTKRICVDCGKANYPGWLPVFCPECF